MLFCINSKKIKEFFYEYIYPIPYELLCSLDLPKLDLKILGTFKFEATSILELAELKQFCKVLK